MAPKRPRHDDAERPAKRQRKGFAVGPANLPEGTHKRKVQKIKQGLIHKAKLKKEYAKLKAREEGHGPRRSVYDGEDEAGDVYAPGPAAEPTLEPHPDRLKLLEAEEEEEESDGPKHSAENQKFRRKKRPRTNPFANETEFARKRKQEAEARQRARQQAEEDRLRKSAERERLRKAMARARSGGPSGQRKLGRESNVLLEKVKRLVGSA